MMHIVPVLILVFGLIRPLQAAAVEEDHQAQVLASYLDAKAKTTDLIAQVRERRAKEEKIDARAAIAVFDEVTTLCGTLSDLRSNKRPIRSIFQSSEESMKWFAMMYACEAMRNLLRIQIDRERFADRTEFLIPLEAKYEEIWRLADETVAKSGED
jgi:hypothetical protein